ncbi:bifunctional hydroxymethylpyrimidine kinase/phosphomethylpyrimidine kinase [Aquiflexum sp.]|uniref:bifunctional hydroxymethylpyrimidine kinase/phosphomethylpyrimidine kinase n=1 Tax=Aquiflexum sp. TaxID=1872584 RepID=UPI0035932B57
MNSALKILTINSLPALGTAGLKMVMGILGPHALPVPTVLLSGTGNMKNHKRFDLPFKELLQSTIELTIQQGHSLIAYIGYLGDSQQAEIIENILIEFKNAIQYVMVDPVCGDNQRLYVNLEIAGSWSRLLALADLATPNVTELAQLSGNDVSTAGDCIKNSIIDFKEKYPKLDFILTGCVEDDKVVNRYYSREKTIESKHDFIPGYYSGTGDTFASLYLLLRFIKGFPIEKSLSMSGKMMECFIRDAWRNHQTNININLLMEKTFQDQKKFITNCYDY